MRISDWSSDVCSSDLRSRRARSRRGTATGNRTSGWPASFLPFSIHPASRRRGTSIRGKDRQESKKADSRSLAPVCTPGGLTHAGRPVHLRAAQAVWMRSEEHTSELQSLMRISYAVFCLKKKNKHTEKNTT